MSLDIAIVPAEERLIPSFHACLDRVARERVYLEMIEAPPLDRIREAQLALIRQQGPSVYAVRGDEVVGWCDIFPHENPRRQHRGVLGMGLLPEFRGRGLGARLVTRALEQAKAFGLEKVELTVYTSNEAAIRLYRQLGFVEEGLIRRFRKLDGVAYDGLLMAIFLDGPSHPGDGG